MKHEQRLRKLALRQGRCPVHLTTPLVCVHCDFQWLGTPEEAHELMQMLERLRECWEPDPPLRSQGECPCGMPLLCLSCNPWPPRGAHQVRHHGMTIPELDRLFFLAGHMRLARKRTGVSAVSRDAWGYPRDTDERARIAQGGAGGRTRRRWCKHGHELIDIRAD
jgi:hypothetical protein